MKTVLFPHPSLCLLQASLYRGGYSRFAPYWMTSTSRTPTPPPPFCSSGIKSPSISPERCCLLEAQLAKKKDVKCNCQLHLQTMILQKINHPETAGTNQDSHWRRLWTWQAVEKQNGHRQALRSCCPGPLTPSFKSRTSRVNQCTIANYTLSPPPVYQLFFFVSLVLSAHLFGRCHFGWIF